MSGSLTWYVARSAGLVAWALAAVSVLWGLALATGVTGSRPSRPWLADLHRFLGGLAVVFTGVHLLALLADRVVPFDLVDVLVPFAADWEPGAVALGVVAGWLLVAVEVTSLLRRHLGRRLWHLVHLGSYAVFWLATFHFLAVGTDARHPLAVAVVDVTVVLVAALTVWRALVGRRTRRRGPGRAGERRTGARPVGARTTSGPASRAA